MSDPSSRTPGRATDHAFSIFQQPWWLDATAPGAWDEVTIEEDGAIVGRLPYVVRARFGIRILTMPTFTQTLGPWIALRSDTLKSRLAAEKDLFTRLIDRLPPHDVFHQALHPSLTNWQPFYWRGFRETTYYTYVIDDLSDLDGVFGRMESRKQRDIKKASKSLDIRADLGADSFYQHITTTLARRGDAPEYPWSAFSRLYEACVARGQGQVISAADAGGVTHAAVFVVWDSSCAYLLITSIDPKWRDDGSGSLVIWEAIKKGAEVSRMFNLEGSMIEGVERSYRAFGGSHVPYHVVTSASRRGHILLAGRDLGRALMGREGIGRNRLER